MLNLPGGTICLQLNTQLFSNVEYNTATRALEVPVIGTRGIRSVTEWIPTEREQQTQTLWDILNKKGGG